jgi:hypothetical protein
MTISDKLKAFSALFYQPRKNHIDELKDYIANFEKLHRNGLSDEEWEAKKREHPGYFADPEVNIIGEE